MKVESAKHGKIQRNTVALEGLDAEKINVYENLNSIGDGPAFSVKYVSR